MTAHTSTLDPDKAQTSDGGRAWLRAIAFGTLAAVLYFAVARLSLMFAFEQANTSAVWPASGLALGGLVVLGLRFWPAVAAGAFALTFSVQPVVPGSAIAIMVGNTLEALVGAALIMRFANGANCLRGARTVFRFIVYAAILAPLLSAAIGVTGLVVFNVIPKSMFGEIFFTWLCGNSVGILVFAPLVFVCSLPQPRWSRERKIEGAVVLVVLVLVGQAICGIFPIGALESWPSAYMVIPVLLWTAFRLGRRGTIMAMIVLMAIAVAGTVRGLEVFPGETPNLSLLYLQIFLAVIAMMNLVVAGLVSELRLANESLELKIATRTHRLQEMMKEKDDLMAIAAHDLQAPLAGMRNLLQLVGSRPEMLSGDVGGRVLHELENTTDNMLGLVSSLLVAKRAEEMGKNLTVAPCDAAELVGRMVDMHQPVAEAKGITLQLEFPPSLPVTTNPESLSQIASNLISNAIKFSPQDTVVEVGLHTARGGRRLVLEVRDSGPGIPAEETEAIFDKFHRADNHPTGGEGSHGIGLYIVEKLTTGLGGEVRIHNREVGGSCFTVNLPSRP